MIPLLESHVSGKEQLEFRSVAGDALYASVDPCYPRWLVNELVHLGAPRWPIPLSTAVQAGKKSTRGSRQGFGPPRPPVWTRCLLRRAFLYDQFAY